MKWKERILLVVLGVLLFLFVLLGVLLWGSLLYDLFSHNHLLEGAGYAEID
jgi:hypothetical protein